MLLSTKSICLFQRLPVRNLAIFKSRRQALDHLLSLTQPSLLSVLDLLSLVSLFSRASYKRRLILNFFRRSFPERLSIPDRLSSIEPIHYFTKSLPVGTLNFAIPALFELVRRGRDKRPFRIAVRAILCCTLPPYARSMHIFAFQFKTPLLTDVTEDKFLITLSRA